MPRPVRILLIIAVVAAGLWYGLGWYVNSTVREGLRKTVARVEGMQLHYGSLDVDMGAHSVTLRDVELRLPQDRFYTAEKVVFADLDQAHATPHYLDVSVEGLITRADFANMERFGPWLRDLGQDYFKGDLRVAYRYNPESKQLAVTNLKVTHEQLGEFESSFSLTRFDMDDLTPPMLLGIQLGGGTASIVDRGVARQFGLDWARSEKLAVVDPKAALAENIAVLSREAAEKDNTQAAEFLAVVSQFIAEGGMIKVRSNPEEPVPWAFFHMGRDLFDNIRLMRLSAELAR